jgi:two-component system, chemotaxis family, chemotaxis protein CheY
LKILIIDDSLVTRRIHKNTLLENKINEDDIFEAEDGEKALKIAQEQNIGLFLLDWNMPKIDGYAFVKKMRNNEKYKDIPIIMITSEAAKYNVVEAIQAGVTNYIVKPIKGDTLWQKISKYFSSGS